MNVQELVSTTREALTAARVFGEPVEHGGVTVIPAAIVRGGVGGGGGKDERGEPGEGGGFGLTARPAGAFVIRNGTVTWRPAFDVNRAVLLAAVVTVACVLRYGRRRGRPSAVGMWDPPPGT